MGLSEVGNLGQLASVLKELVVLKALSESGTVDYPYKPGDHVKVTANIETLKRMQQGHGGWNDSMKNVHI